MLSAVPITKDWLVVLELVGRLLLFEHFCDSSLQISICGAWRSNPERHERHLFIPVPTLSAIGSVSLAVERAMNSTSCHRCGVSVAAVSRSEPLALQARECDRG